MLPLATLSHAVLGAPSRHSDALAKAREGEDASDGFRAAVFLDDAKTGATQWHDLGVSLMRLAASGPKKNQNKFAKIVDGFQVQNFAAANAAHAIDVDELLMAQAADDQFMSGKRGSGPSPSASFTSSSNVWPVPSNRRLANWRLKLTETRGPSVWAPGMRAVIDFSKRMAAMRVHGIGSDFSSVTTPTAPARRRDSQRISPFCRCAAIGPGQDLGAPVRKTAILPLRSMPFRSS